MESNLKALDRTKCQKGKKMKIELKEALDKTNCRKGKRMKIELIGIRIEVIGIRIEKIRMVIQENKTRTQTQSM